MAASPQRMRQELEQMSLEGLALLRWRMAWRHQARTKQLAPEDHSWNFFGIQSGRGWGKTKSAANWLGIQACLDAGSYNFVVAPTHEDLMKYCFNGPTGLLNVIPRSLVLDWKISPYPILTVWTGGIPAVIMGFSAEKPNRLRGPQCLIGDTRITLADGSTCHIDAVRVGAWVQTTHGAHRVTAAWMSNPDAELWQLTTVQGRVIRGTMNHLIRVPNNGWVELWRLKKGMSLFTEEKFSVVNQMVISNGSNGWVQDLSVNESVYTCIGRFIEMSKDPLCLVTSFITWIATKRTTIPAILRRFRKLSTVGTMRGEKNKAPSNVASTWRDCTSVGNKLLGALSLVSGAIANSKAALGAIPESFVARSAATDSVPTLSNLRLENASNAAAATSPVKVFNHSATSDAGADIAQELSIGPIADTDVVLNVEKLPMRAPVYDLEIEEAHEFFANGILVHNCHRAWCDEVAAWRYPEEAWANLEFGLRLGTHPQIFWTGTPKPRPFIRQLVKLPKSVIVNGSTYENRANLADATFSNIAKYEGTVIGRQEIHGELIDPEEAGFVKRSQWKLWPAKRPLPKFRFILMSFDTAFTERNFDQKTQRTDPTACSVWGLFSHNGTDCVMLLDCWDEHLSFPQLIKRVKLERSYTYGDRDEPVLRPAIVPREQRPAHQGRPPDLMLVEDKGSGISLRQQLAQENIFMHAYNPGDMDKLSRLHAVSPMFPNGRVWAVESNTVPGQPRTWADPLITQVCSYVGEGSLDHDDLLDTATQALLYFMHKFNFTFTVHIDPHAVTKINLDKLKRASRKNPYDGG